MVGSMVGEVGPPSGTAAWPNKKDKRKRPADVIEPNAQQSPHTSKRAQIADGRQGGPDAIRKHIRRIYDIQSSLQQCSAASSDPTSLQASYEHLLQTATGEYCATRRLAARFIPRFLHLFPHRVDAAALALISIYSAEQPALDSLPAIVEAGQVDALQGLATVLDIAYKLIDKAIPTVLRLVDFQMRLIVALTRVGEVQSKECNQQQPQGQILSGVMLRKPDPDVLQQFIQRTFELFPRVAMSVCLQTFRSQDLMMHSSAIWLLKHQLLKEELSAAGTPAPNGHSQDMEVEVASIVKVETVAESNGDAHGTQQQAADKAKAAAKAGGGETLVAPQHCLARTVLSALPDTQQWLRQAITSITRDKRVQLSKEAAAVVQQLLSLAAPPPSAAVTAPAGAAAGNTHTKAEGGQPGPKQAAAGQQGHAAHFVLPPPAAASQPGARQAIHAIAGRPDLVAPPRTSTPDTQQAAGGTDMVISSPGPPPELAQPLTPLAVGGGPVTRADCCLYISQLPPTLNPAHLKQECEKHNGIVDSVHVGPAARLPAGHALVVFKTVQDAAHCYMGMVDTPVWAPGHPVRCEFCPGLPADCPMRLQAGPARPASDWIWCAQIATAEDIYAAIQAAGLPLPKAVLRVAGNKPGCLLHMPDATCVQSIVEFVLRRFLPHAQPPPFILPPALQQQHSMPAPPVQPAHAVQPSATGAQDVNLQRAPSLHASGSLPLGPPQQQPAGTHGDGTQQHQGRYSLLVSQLPDNFGADGLIAAFRRYGEVLSWELMRPSRAVLNFSTHAGAAQALRALHNGKLAGNVIRVEWTTMEPQQQQQQQHMPRTPGTVLPSRQSTPGHTAGFTPTHAPSPYPHQQPIHTPTTGGLPTAGSVPRLQAHTAQVYGNQPTPTLARRLSVTAQQADVPPAGMQPPPPRQQQQQQLAGPLQGRPVPTMPVPTWQGVLAKTGVPVCNIMCMPPESSVPSTPEPKQWPVVMDVRKRAPPSQFAMFWGRVPPAERAARRLLPASAADTERLAQFARYLAGKERAGVIELEETPSTVYVIVPTLESASMLGLSYDPQRDAAALFAAIIPNNYTH